MATIGIYDSGIGGLTTAKVVLDRFVGNDIYYLADNRNHPFGNTDEDKLKEIVANGIKKVRAHADIVVLACNTASSVTDDKDVIKLLPPVDKCADIAEDTLIMATARTLSKLKDIDNFKVADTSELATMVEIHASLNSVKGHLNMDELLPYFEERIARFKGIKNVILGCSHYLYCKEQISSVLGEINYFDGNENLCEQLQQNITAYTDKPSKIAFDFTLQNDEKKYRKILQILINNR